MCKHILFNNFSLKDLGRLQTFSMMTNENDGYGAIIRSKSGVLESFKSLDAGAFYIALTQKLLQGDTQTLVVHHRTSTNEGGLDYAHPFEYAGHYLTHNGVVQVPGTHETKTKNDSEALLHHLIKSGYDTEAISGYFSCFILNKTETIVLVDNLAPIYTDGRVYSSHKLTEHFKKIELVKKTLDTQTGKVLDSQRIKVTKSNYGYSSMGKSLGSYDWEPMPYYPENSSILENFLDYLSPNEEDGLWEEMDYRRLKHKVRDLVTNLGLSAKEEEVIEIANFFAA